MDLSVRILGTATANDLRERTTVPVLHIGKDGYSRGALATVECFNYHAARNLSRACEVLNVKDTRDLFERVPPSALAVPRVGAIALAVLGAAFEAKGLGGSSPLEAWVQRHANGEGVEHAMVTFDTMKKREAAELQNERAERKRRKRARRDQAHAVHVDRHSKRHERTPR